MPDVIDLLEPGTLTCPPPRRLPFFFLPNLIGEHLLARPLRAYLNLFGLLWVLSAAMMLLFRSSAWFWLPLLGLLGLRLLLPCYHLYRDVREDYLLMRDGLVMMATVIRVRPCYDDTGNPIGALLDCSVQISPQRTSVGSVWFTDAGAAVRLSAADSVRVICLTRAPGVWRLVEP